MTPTNKGLYHYCDKCKSYSTNPDKKYKCIFSHSMIREATKDGDCIRFVAKNSEVYTEMR